MRFAFIHAEKANHDVTRMCELLEVSRSGYYAWAQRDESDHAKEDRRLMVRIRTVYEEERGFAGSPRIHGALQGEGTKVGRKRVARLMREAGLRARHTRKYRACTNSRHEHPIAPNHLDRQFAEVRFFRQVWVGDVTYVKTDEGWLYLAIVLDVWSRCIVGWSMGSTIGTALTKRALEAAVLKAGGPPAMFHSDRGTEYAGKEYRELLDKHGIEQSMSAKGDCWDNAVAESFFATLKKELIYLTSYSTRAEARQEIFEYIEVFYNRSRRHSALGYRSPEAFIRAAA